MKKCVSCSKDLPDTAMHCVFCGAKQPAAPGPAPGAPPPAGAQAKTVLGYSAAELMKQAGINPAAPAGAPARPATAPAAAPSAVSGHGATMLAAPAPNLGGPSPFAPPGPQPGPAPFAQPNAAPPPGFPPAPAGGSPFPQPNAAAGGPSPFASGPQPGPAPSGGAAHAATMFAGPAASQPFPQQPAAGFPPGPSPFAQPGSQPPFAQPQPGPSFGPALPGPIPPGAATMPPPSNFGPPQGGQFGGSANAATMFMPGSSPAPAPSPGPSPFAQPAPAPNLGGPSPYGQPGPAPSTSPYGQPGPAPSPYGQPAGMGGYNPVPVGQPAGMGYNPAPVGQQPPFLASQTAARMGRPVEPFDEAVRLVLLGFGVLLLIAFCTPTTTGPLTFHWSAIIHAAGKAKIPSLMIAACGVLGIVLAFVPLAYATRAALAAAVGLMPILLTIALGGSFEWRPLLTIVGLVTLIPGLLMRQEYRHHMVPRILVTVGAVAVLLPLLVPVGGTIPLVGMLKAIGSAPGKAKVAALFGVIPPILVLASLVAWLPAPSSAAAKAIAWTLIVWSLVDHYVDLLLAGGIGAAVKASPFAALLAPIPQMAYVAIAAYGLAALIGKQLESR